MRNVKVGLLAVVAVLALGLLATGCAKRTTSTKGGASLQKVHFDFDKSNIKPEFESVLQGNANWINGHKSSNVVIEGHCDERGTAEYNIALGDRRAKSSMNYLTNLGVAGAQLSTVSYGKERPVCTQHDEACWWQNRRDEFVAK